MLITASVNLNQRPTEDDTLPLTMQQRYDKLNNELTRSQSGNLTGFHHGVQFTIVGKIKNGTARFKFVASKGSFVTWDNRWRATEQEVLRELFAHAELWAMFASIR